MKGQLVRSFILFIASCATAIGQTTEISGKVVEAVSGDAVEFATVIVAEPGSGRQITGATTSPGGSFEITTDATEFYIEVSFIGFQSQTLVDFETINGKIDLGTIKINEDNQLLEEIVVEADRSTTEFRLDKRIFNVGADLSSTGASALDILNNVPSVNVNIEGDIALRGSTGVQILINGKPSVLTNDDGGNALGTITADMIERIEVITNPSAKYDAEGTSGIINIVIKKEERTGTNGSVTVNTGTPHNHSLGLSLNHRTEKWNLFSQLGVGYRELPNDRRNINRDLTTGVEIRSEGEEFRNEQFYNLILGTDYYFDPLNVLTVSGTFAYEIEDQPSATTFQSYDGEGNLTSEWRREEDTEALNPKYQYELQYRREFEDNEDHVLMFSALGSFFGKDQSSDFTNTTIQGEDNDSDQRTRTDFREGEYTFKLDYAHPLGETWTLETGAQYILNDVSNDFAVSNLEDGDFVDDPNLTNIFDWDQKVLGVYGTAAYEKDKWGVMGGLRLENTDLFTLLETTGEENNQNYTNFFPSFHSSYKFSESHSMQAGYSRRIYRPRLWDLNPFFNIRNDFNIRVGNPDLQPEYTDSYEIVSMHTFENFDINYGVYHRYTTDVVERVTFFEDNRNIRRPVNIGTNRATGVEVNAKYTPNNWLAVNGDLNYFYFDRDGELEGQSFDFSGEWWSAKVTTKFKLPAEIDFEMTGQFQSTVQTLQGEEFGNAFLDLGLRKKVMKGRGVFNLSVRDVFASRIGRTENTQPEFFTMSRSLRGRFVTLGFSFGFGKGEAMEFSARKRL
ncbi:MAG: outer membrane beta-barrel family protein [Bacteroidota bacterium]